MSSYNYTDYQENQQNATAKVTTKNTQKVGFFKLRDDGDEALVRFNISSTDDIDFATVHTINADGKWMRVSCLNPISKFRSDDCPLCRANAGGDTSISVASKKIYIQMLAAYRDKATGSFTAPVPVIWERAEDFAREIATKLRDYGDLKQVLWKVTRNGAAGYLKTTYSVDYAVPAVFKPELVPADFSAFENFNIAKHSYWEKTEDEINTFLETGSFPEVQRAPRTETAPMQPTYTQPVQETPAQPVTPIQPQVQKESGFKGSENYPSRNFSGFSF